MERSARLALIYDTELKLLVVGGLVSLTRVGGTALVRQFTLMRQTC